jgi:hypothetical protein
MKILTDSKYEETLLEEYRYGYDAGLEDANESFVKELKARFLDTMTTLSEREIIGNLLGKILTQ